MAIGDHITVLRNGRLVADAAVAQIDIPWIIQAMVGAEHKQFDYHPHPIGAPVLKVQGLSLRRGHGATGHQRGQRKNRGEKMLHGAISWHSRVAAWFPR